MASKRSWSQPKGLWADQLYEVSAIFHYFNVYFGFTSTNTLSTPAFSLRVKIRNRYYGLTTPLRTRQQGIPHLLWYMAQMPCYLSKSTPQPGDVTISWKRVSTTPTSKLTTFCFQVLALIHYFFTSVLPLKFSAMRYLTVFILIHIKQKQMRYVSNAKWI